MIKWTEQKLKDAGYEIQNAKITYIDLSAEDHGCLTLSMALDGSGWGCVYGGYKLGTAGTYMKEEELCGSAAGLECIIRIMHTLGVDRFTELNGKYIRVATKGWGSSISIVGNIINDKWFDQKSFFEDFKQNTGAQ